MINDKELKFLQQVAISIVLASDEDPNEDNQEYYENILNALINKYIDTVKDESNDRD